MSIQIFKKPGKTIEGKFLNAAFRSYNKNIVALRSRDNRLEEFRISKPTQLVEVWNDSIEDPLLITCYQHINAQCDSPEKLAPYKLVDLDDSEVEIIGAIDGPLQRVKAPVDIPDPMLFTDKIRPLIRQDPSLIWEEEFQKMINLSLNDHTNMFIMDNTGKTLTLGGQKGQWIDDSVWCSSNYILRDDAYTYNTWAKANEWEPFPQEKSKYAAVD